MRPPVVLALALAALPARGEIESFPVERFRPSLDRDGVFDVESGAVPGHLDFDVALWGNYALNPLVLALNGERVVSLVQHRVGANLVGQLSLFEWVELGVDVPAVLFQARDTKQLERDVTDAQDLSVVAVGDIRFAPKLRLLRERASNLPVDGILNLAVIGAFTVPSASTLEGYGAKGYSGEGQPTIAPELALSRAFGPFRLAGNVGFKWRPEERKVLNLVVGDELFYRAGGAFNLAQSTAVPIEVGVSVNGGTYAFQPFSSGFEENPLELLGGVTFSPMPFLQIFGAAGFGLISGFGTPDFRALLGVRFTPRNDDSDNDGVLNSADSCVNDPEDKDGFKDGDGCPELDNDEDGLKDDADGCPNDPEDKDNFEDENGCPDPDNDKDGLNDLDDACRDLAGPVANKGCPYGDTDKDGLNDDVDKCPSEAGDKDNGGCPWRDSDGDTVLDKDDRCPDVPGLPSFKGCADKDHDGIADPDDKCPDEAEVINGIDDEDGCPDKGKSVVKLTKEKIEIIEKVYFDTAKATIQPRSFNLLDQVAAVLKANPQLLKLRVEGHTDDKGKDAYNLKLSQARAESVRQYLVDKGVEGARLEAQGFGETKPIASNKSGAGREQNRRVEFRILEVDGAAAGAAATGDTVQIETKP